MRDAFIVGVHTTKFGKRPDAGVKDLTAETVRGVLADAGLDQGRLQSAWFSNSAWGMNGFQHCIRGQVALRPIGIDAIPITNVENACASGSTALHGAWKDVASGLYDVSLAVGAEKLHRANKFLVFAGFLAGTDVEAAADQFDLAFVPLATETYYFAVAESTVQSTPAVQHLVSVIAGSEFRRRVEKLRGYDPRHSGRWESVSSLFE